MKIAGISSVKLADANEGVIANKYLYNDKELFDDGGLNWYDYGFRNYDPQIGRFMQLDPLTFEYPELTPFQYASDDPITNIDLDGLEGDLANVAKAAAKTVEKTTLSSAAHPKVLAEVLIKLQPVVNAGSITKSFFSGIWSSVVETFKGVAHVAAHPLNTAGAIIKAVIHPIQTAQAVGKMVKQAYHTFVNGDANTKAKMLGHLAGDIGQLFLGTGEEKVALDVAEEGGKVAEVSKGIEEAEDLGKVSEGTVEGTKTVSPKFEEAPKKGETAATKNGKLMHKQYKEDEILKGVREKEFRLPSGNRIDFIDFENGTIYELKPNNLRAIKQGYKQLEKYKEELRSMPQYKGIQWKTVLDTY